MMGFDTSMFAMNYASISSVMKFFAAIGLVIAAALSWQGVFVGITGAIAGFLPSVIDTPMVHGLIVAIISTLLCIGLIFLMFNYGKAKPSPASNGNGNGATNENDDNPDSDS